MDSIRIKVCGITRLQDALAAVAAGVDALGFIFFERSPRAVSPEDARVIIEHLPPFVDTVGVFVDREPSEVEEIVQFCRLGYVQLHGQESPKYCERLARLTAPCQLIKALRLGGPAVTPEEVAPYARHVKGFLLDTWKQGMAGGTGTSFDWSLVRTLNLQRPFILAGGLDPESVVAAIEAAHPYGVDINSGVESAPGIKDPDRIIELVRAIRLLSRGL